MRSGGTAFGLATLLFAGWLTCQARCIAQDERLDVPSQERLTELRSKMRAMLAFKSHFAARSARDKAAAAGVFLQLAAENAEDPGTRYAFLLEGLEFAIEALDWNRVRFATETLGTSYNLDGFTLQVDAALRMLSVEGAGEKAQLIAESLELSRACFEAGKLDTLERLLDAVRGAAKGLESAGARNEYEQLIGALRSRKLYEEAVAQITKSPKDPAANLVVGTYRCFEQGDFEGGLEAIVLGSDPALAECARADLQEPTDSKKRQAVGDLWSQWALGQKDERRYYGAVRALHWFELAQSGMDTLDKIELEHRIGSLKKRLEEEGFPSTVRVGSASSRIDRRTVHGADAVAAVDKGLAWLVAHQDDDGKWDADEFDKHCGGTPCTGAGSGVHDVGLTGLALLAFLGDGHYPNRNTRFQVSVRRGISWLVGQMIEGEDDGLIGGRKGHAFMYNHAIATLALARVCLRESDPSIRQACQRAVNFVLRARNPALTWRYECPPNGENDSSITGWMVAILKSAESAGFSFDHDAYACALKLFDMLTDQRTGRCGYISRGESPARPTGKSDMHPSVLSESLTAVAICSRISLGQSPRTVPMLSRHAKLLMAKPPKWSADGSTNDLYYWYYGTEAIYRMQGLSPTHWSEWYKALKTALVGSQRRDGHVDGSWDPNGPWGEDGGRIYSTAMGVLALSTPWRGVG